MCVCVCVWEKPLILCGINKWTVVSLYVIKHHFLKGRTGVEV